MYKMTIGSVIKSKRQQKDLTQEQFAEYFNVSVSAVSQWESGKTTPDFSLLVPLSEFFGISLDELFGRTPGEKESAIEKYNEKDSILSNEGKVDEEIRLWRDALEKFPGDFHCMSMLADSLYLSLVANTENREEKAKECVSLCECILRDCTDGSIRENAVQTLVYIYSMRGEPFADEKKAVEYAMSAGSMIISREKLLESAYFTEESRAKKLSAKHRNRLFYLSQLTASLVYDTDVSPEEYLAALACALKLWQTVVYDGNYLFYHCRISDIYFYTAKTYAVMKNRKETLNAIEKMLFHAQLYDTLPEKEVHYTSSFIRESTFDAKKTSKNVTDSQTCSALKLLLQKEFDFIRNDEEYISLTEKYGDGSLR